MTEGKRWDQYWEEHPNLRRWLVPDESVTSLTQRLRKENPDLRRALDLGCGLGRHTVFMAQQGLEVSAVDNSPDALQHCREWLEREGLNAQLSLSEMTDLSCLPEPVDFVLCYFVIHHGTLATMQRTCREVLRVLSPGGFFFTNFWSRDAEDKMVGEEIEPGTFAFTEGEEKGIPHHFTSPEELPELLEGFDVLETERARHWRILCRKPGQAGAGEFL